MTTLIPTLLAKKLGKFCKRVRLNQPAVIRTLVFNVLTTYHPEIGEEKTSLFRGARLQQRHFDAYERGTTFVKAVLAGHQVRQLGVMCEAIGLYHGGVIRVLLRNFINTTKPGPAEDAFLLTARQLMSRQPSSIRWGNGCDRTAGQRYAQARAFIDQHPNLSPGTIASALRGLGLRYSRERIAELLSYI